MMKRLTDCYDCKYLRKPEICEYCDEGDSFEPKREQPLDFENRFYEGDYDDDD